ncbi:hypothetical protein BG003_011743 [Podila horticola]|nr:hypothetical protein BG003_011743 [Podila horticola]
MSKRPRYSDDLLDQETGDTESQLTSELPKTLKTPKTPNRRSGRFNIIRPVPYTRRNDNSRPGIKGRWPKRSDEQKAEALQELLTWRKDAYERWVASRPYRVGAETWILPDKMSKQLSQRFSRATTAEAVEDIAFACRWMPLGFQSGSEEEVSGRIWFVEIAQVLAKLSYKIDALGQSNNRSEGDGDGGDGDEDLLESEYVPSAGTGSDRSATQRPRVSRK